MFLMFSFSGGLRGWGLQVPQKTSTWIFITRHKNLLLLCSPTNFFTVSYLEFSLWLHGQTRKFWVILMLPKRFLQGPPGSIQSRWSCVQNSFCGYLILICLSQKAELWGTHLLGSKTIGPQILYPVQPGNYHFVKCIHKPTKKSDYKNWKLLMWNFSMVKWNCA